MYSKHVEELLEQGKAYKAWESREELNALRQAAQTAKENFVYREREYTASQLASYAKENRKPVVRLRAPNHPITVDDLILGPVTVAPEDLEDFVILKADGFPTYHFAVVVDDTAMKVTHVLRGQEHLMNTHKHLAIYEALGWAPPRHGHLPLIFNPQGSKMSKRDKAKTARKAARDEQAQRKASGIDASGWEWLAARSNTPIGALVEFMKKKSDDVTTATRIAEALGATLPLIDVMDFRKCGYVPEALVNYMALLGWSPGDDREILTVEEMTTAFSADRIAKTPARFDPAKLEWLNAEYIRCLSDDRIYQLLEEYIASNTTHMSGVGTEKTRTLFSMMRQRIRTFDDFIEKTRFFFHPPTQYDPKSAKKWIVKGEGLARLRAAYEALSGLKEWDAESVFACMEQAAASLECNVGKLAQPCRVAVAGSAVTPPIGDTLAFIGRGEVLNRLESCLVAFSTNSVE